MNSYRGLFVVLIIWMVAITGLTIAQSRMIGSVSVANSNFQEIIAELRMVINDLNDEVDFLKDRIKEMYKLYKIKSVRKLTVTAYSPRRIETDSDPHINASMRKVREGTVAVSRDLFKDGWVFGKKVYIEGYGIFEIADLMNKRFTNRIDIFMWNTRQARKFGKKKLTVALLDI